MEHINVNCIEKAIDKLLETGELSYSNLERLNILCKAKHNLTHVNQEFTEENAKEWAKSMNPPARWTIEQTTAAMKQCGFSHDPCEFWIVMNAMFSDYGKTLIKHNLDKPEVWAALAHDFIDDPDAEPDKVGRYWRDIVKH